MRDVRKNQEYFSSYLDYQYSRVEKKTGKFKESSGEKKQRILTSLTGYETDLLKAEFSAGASKEDLKVLLIRAIEIASEYKSITYEDFLVLLSMAIILEVEKEAVKLLDANKEIVETDRLINFLASYIRDGKAEWDEKLTLKKEYSNINDVFLASNKIEAMSSYLDSWYTKHLGFAWYDSHLKDTDTYNGYWSFESAAVTKILGLNDEKIEESEYYPVL